MSSSTNVEVDGLEITVQPKTYCAAANSTMMDSVRNMTSSLVLAQVGNKSKVLLVLKNDGFKIRLFDTTQIIITNSLI